MAGASSLDSQPDPGDASCDVLVVGAGPAGCAAARMLARAGVRVVLADARAFPRDKVCGDGLISDALASLEALGLRERVAAEWVRAGELRIDAPGGASVALAGEFACLPRRTFDRLLCEGAREAGAAFRPGLAALGPLDDGGRVRGARFRADGREIRIRAPLTLLATGANASALRDFGLAVRLQPAAVAGRAYFAAPPQIAARYPGLIIAYDREWCPGYGWIFPSPGSRFNIGVGLFSGATAGGRLHAFWRSFITRFAPAREIVAASRQESQFRGAALRTGLSDMTFGRPGLLAIGEAASVTYPATGEGIGKAMESGMVAATLCRHALDGDCRVETLHGEYGSGFRRQFASRYRAYAVAQSWAASPLLLNLLAGRASRGRFARQELEALIAERGDARSLFSVRGLVTALIR